ncbi:hypothetical protein ES332_A01G133800v1 [Gossypium tomentosum]|uniref:B box-type domain-containing protein n=1 Tax=Gossypium tomentosum TaxID=34277 RepID=A0A5D2RQ60_GOSTO|nr:hypothetical protein ES332_A01G133800v1 [Gossypium tomentosum]
MKIQCDVCNKEEASLLCTADEAVLCHSYDHVVHHANNLASKHPRFSLLHPSSSKQDPLCNICQRFLVQRCDSVVAKFKSQPSDKNLVHFNSPSLAMKINKSDGDKHLIETPPSWHVEDFHYSSSPPSAFTNVSNLFFPFYSLILQ